jgi:hypothetical protein
MNSNEGLSSQGSRSSPPRSVMAARLLREGRWVQTARMDGHDIVVVTSGIASATTSVILAPRTHRFADGTHRTTPRERRAPDQCQPCRRSSRRPARFSNARGLRATARGSTMSVADIRRCALPGREQTSRDVSGTRRQGRSLMPGRRRAPARLGAMDTVRDRSADKVTAIAWIRDRAANRRSMNSAGAGFWGFRQ